MLPFAMYSLNVLDISAIDDGFCMVFRDAWKVSPLKYNSSNSALCHNSKRRSSASWWSFELEFLGGSCDNKFCISITALSKVPFNEESWIHSFNSLIVSSIYLFPQEPGGKRKRFLHQKKYRILYRWSLYRDGIASLRPRVFDCSGSCCIVVITSGGILCLLLSNGLSLSFRLVLCRFSSVSVLHALLQCWHVKCSFERKYWLTLLTGHNGEVWVLGRVLFDLLYSLGP